MSHRFDALIDKIRAPEHDPRSSSAINAPVFRFSFEHVRARFEQEAGDRTMRRIARFAY